MVIFAEHRYYGQSLPYGNKSLTPDPNFNGFLTSEQALADYAYLLHYIKVVQYQNVILFCICNKAKNIEFCDIMTIFDM